MLKNSNKLIFKFFISFSICLVIFWNNHIFSSSIIDKNYLDITSNSAVVIDYVSGRTLYEKNATQKKKMASLTKIMTSILLVENCDLDEMVEVPKEAALIGGSTVGLKYKDMVSVKSLLYGMLLPSGNDCALTAAIHVAGSVENFAILMNKKAEEIGLTDTSFANPHGLDNDEHYTSALSMAKITRYALNYDIINEIVNTKTATINFGSFTKTLNNTNALLRTYSKADGVKTGFTNGANKCLSASATKDDFRLIAIILDASTSNVRFNEAKNLLEESFNKYDLYDISNYLHFYICIPVPKGSKDYYEEKIDENYIIALTQEEYDNIYIKQNLPLKLTPPIKVGDYIGNIELYVEDELLYTKNIYAKYNINKNSMKDYLKKQIKDIFTKNN